MLRRGVWFKDKILTKDFLRGILILSLNELVHITMQKKVQKLIKSLLPYQPERVFLFGSWARGEEDELSDLDLVVIKQTSAPFWDRLREVARLLPAETGGVDILVYSPDEFATMQQEGNAFAEMITEEALLIYDHQAKS